MTIQSLSIFALIPARGGSKSIIRKNLRQVGGMSLLARAVSVAASLDWIDAVVFSSDDPEMIDEAQKAGAGLAVKRPEALATDTAAPADVWRHAWLEAERVFDRRFDLSILLEPTSPLRTGEDIEKTVAIVAEKNAQAAVTVSPVPAHYSPYKTLTRDEQGLIGFYVEGGAKFNIRQRIPVQYYHRNGLCYCVRRDHLVGRGLIVDSDAVGVIIERPIVNIDDPFELELADWLLARQERLLNCLT